MYSQEIEETPRTYRNFTYVMHELHGHRTGLTNFLRHLRGERTFQNGATRGRFPDRIWGGF